MCSVLKGIGKFVLIVLLAAILIALVIEFFYLPGYLFGDEKVTPGEDRGDEITVMSYNIRYFNPLDLGNKSWFYRAALVTEDVKAVSPDIIGFQEVTFIHQAYLERVMEGYESIVSYRDNFILSEGCPIFYRTDKYELLDGGSFWISETPDEMTKIEGAEHYRICVWVKLRDKTNGEYISVFNAHLDHKGERARELGIEVVLEKMNELGEGTLVLLGDLNDTPDSAAIKTASSALNDAAVNASVSEGGATHHAWGEELDKERIDYFMISGDKENILEYRVINNLHGDSYASDHFPLYVKIRYN